MSEENQTLAQRREKAESLANLGVNLYSNNFKPANAVKELLPKGDSLEAQEAEPAGTSYSIAGRIMAMRKFGKAAFCTVADKSGQIQLYLKKDILGATTVRDLGTIKGRVDNNLYIELI
jgi:lysyl-tRNA synthetase class 2